MFGERHFCVSLSFFRWSDFRDFYFRLLRSPRSLQQLLEMLIASRWPVKMQIFTAGNKGREIA